MARAGRQPAGRARVDNPVRQRRRHEVEPAGLGVYRYGLQGTPTQWALAEALTELEPGAEGTALYSSGLAAITTALLAVLSPGDELLVPDSVYGPTRKFCDTILKRFGVATRYYDPLRHPRGAARRPARSCSKARAR